MKRIKDGRGRIRTHGPRLPDFCFQDRRIRPLCHSSLRKGLFISDFLNSVKRFLNKENQQISLLSGKERYISSSNNGNKALPKTDAPSLSGVIPVWDNAFRDDKFFHAATIG